MTQDMLFGGPDEKAKTRKRAAKPKVECVLTTREISRYIRFFNEKVRLHNVQETSGVIRNIQRILEPKEGREQISPQDIADALKNYANDEFVKGLPQQRRKHVRSFFTYENVLVWRKPVAERPCKLKNASLQALESVERFQPAPLTAPVQPEPITEDEEIEF